MSRVFNRCCCGGACSGEGPYKVCVINHNNSIGAYSTSLKGGHLSIFHQSMNTDLVSEILSVPVSSDEEIIINKINESCVIVVGATDFGQGYSGTFPNHTISPFLAGYYGYDRFHIPSSQPLIDAISKRVCKEGAMLIIASGAAEDWGNYYDSIDADYDGCPNAAGNAILSEDHIAEINSFLENIRNSEYYEAPVGYAPLSFSNLAGFEHYPSFKGCDLHQINSIGGSGVINMSDFIGCGNVNSPDCSYQSCNWLYTSCPCCNGCEDCGNGSAASCDNCGYCGRYGREHWGHSTYNLLKVGTSSIGEASWLNDPNSEDFLEGLCIHKQSFGLVLEGVPIHDLENIDGYTVNETGFAVQKAGNGYILAWADPFTWLGGLDGSLWNKNVWQRFNCPVEAAGQTACYTDNVISDDNYGYWPYSDNGYVMERLIFKLIGKQIGELQ